MNHGVTWCADTERAARLRFEHVYRESVGVWHWEAQPEHVKQHFRDAVEAEREATR